MINKRKLCLVTGGGRGIGRAIALRLAEDGYDIGIGDIDEDSAINVVNEVQTKGVKGFGFKLDVTNAKRVEDWVSIAHKEFGEIYGLVNNAGTITGAGMCELTEKDWDKVYDVNAKGVWLCIKAVVPEMKERKSGKIVNISSVAGKTARPNFIHYNSSKSAVLGITMSAAIELAPYGVNVNAVCPGTVDNPAFWAQLDRDLKDKVGLKENESLRDRNLPLIPMGRFVKPEDVAAAVSFFVSPDSDAITGENLDVACGRDLYI